MVLQYQITQNAPIKEAIRLILQKSNSWLNPALPLKKAAFFLEKKGIVKIRRSFFVTCADPQDTLDFYFVKNPECRNHILIEADFDEQKDEVVCESCGRILFPLRYKKKIHQVYSTRIQFFPLAKWFEDVLSLHTNHWKKTGEGLYHVLGEKKAVWFIIPDFFADSFLEDAEFCKSAPTVLLKSCATQDIPAFFPLQGVVFSLSEFLTKKVAVKEMTEKAERVWQMTQLPALPALEKKSQEQGCNPPLFLQICVKLEGVYLNNIEIISKKAHMRFDIFNIFLEQYWKDFARGIPPQEHTPLTLEQIAEKLEQKSIKIEDLEHQVRRPINKIQKTIEVLFSENQETKITRNDVIQTLGWPGYKKKSHGYRLNPHTLVFCKQPWKV